MNYQQSILAAEFHQKNPDVVIFDKESKRIAPDYAAWLEANLKPVLEEEVARFKAAFPAEVIRDSSNKVSIMYVSWLECALIFLRKDDKEKVK